jgi:hypothetical protein
VQNSQSFLQYSPVTVHVLITGNRYCWCMVA